MRLISDISQHENKFSEKGDYIDLCTTFRGSMDRLQRSDLDDKIMYTFSKEIESDHKKQEISIDVYINSYEPVIHQTPKTRIRSIIRTKK